MRHQMPPSLLGGKSLREPDQREIVDERRGKSSRMPACGSLGAGLHLLTTAPGVF